MPLQASDVASTTGSQLQIKKDGPKLDRQDEEKELYKRNLAFYRLDSRCKIVETN